MTPETKRYLDEAAASRLLNLSPRTLQRYRQDGDGPRFIRAGHRRVLYDPDALDAWLKSRTFDSRAAELASAA